jgi:hypothetical protein
MDSHLSQEPCNQVSKDNGLVGLGIAWRRGDAGRRPQVTLPLIEPSIARTSVKEQHTGRTVNEPASIERLDASILHRLDRGDKSRILGFYGLDLDRSLVSLSVLELPLLFAALTDALFHGPKSV